MSVSDVTVMILDRPQHRGARQAGPEDRRTAQFYLIPAGDVAGEIAAARRGTGVNLLYGIGGTPEGVVAAAASNAWAG